MTDAPLLLHRDAMLPLTRLFLGAGSLLPLYGFWDLVVRPWPAALSLFGLPLAVIGLAGLAMGVGLLAAAVLGPEREVWLDPARRRLVETGRVALFGRVRRETPLDAIRAVRVVTVTETDGPDSLALDLTIDGRRWPRRLVSLPRSDGARLDEIADRLRAATQP